MVGYQSAAVALLMSVGLSSAALGQGRPDPAELIAAQQKALAKLSYFYCFREQFAIR